MQRFLSIDPEKCTGCRICELACSFKKTGEFSPVRSRIKVMKDESISLNVPVVCEHCSEAPCITACPMGLITRDPVSGVVKSNESACIGCKACVIACPLGGISFDVSLGVSVKCDLCDGDPQCVKLCPTGALTFVRADTADLAKRRATMWRIGESVVASRK